MPAKKQPPQKMTTEDILRRLYNNPTGDEVEEIKKQVLKDFYGITDLYSIEQLVAQSQDPEQKKLTFEQFTKKSKKFIKEKLIVP